MKIEVNVVDAEAGIPVVIEYNDILYFQQPPVENPKPRYHNPYKFRRH